MSALLKEIPTTPAVYSELYNLLCEKMPVAPIVSKTHNRNAVEVLTILGKMLDNDKFSARQRKDVIAYVQALGHFVEEFEKRVYPVESTKASDVLKFLMEVNGLNQNDLGDEIGVQPVVSRILTGERELTKQHIENLAKRFNVSPAIFFD